MRKWHRAAQRVLQLALVMTMACASACSPDDDAPLIRVDLRTDYAPNVEFDVVRLQIGDGDLAFRSDHLVRGASDFVRGERIDETTVQPGAVPLTVTLYRAGTPVATRRVSAIVESAITVVTVVITRSCEGVECPNDNPLFDSCLGGQCVDPRCTVETPEFCPDAFCGSDTECEAVSCAEPQCESNVCFSLPDDSRCESGERCDAILGCTPEETMRDAGLDAEPLDASMDGGNDAALDAGTDVPVDAFDAGTDAGPPPLACPILDTNAVFLFDFETITDLVTGVNGIHSGTGIISGDSPCGGGVLDVPLGLNHFRIPDRDTFQLSEGSIDFWAKLPAVAQFEAILSRDASGRALPGHIGVFYTAEGEIVVRNQTTINSGACSGAGTVPADTWVRIGIHFGTGGVALYINGERRSRAGSYEFLAGVTSSCEDPITVGIAGNANPFVLGANMGTSAEGSHLPISQPYEGLQLDHLRLSSVRRDYTAEVYP